MNTKINHFAKFLGRKVLHKKNEYILHAVSLTHLLVLNGKPDPIAVAIDECRIICKDEQEVIKNGLPADIAIIKRGQGDYINIDRLRTLTDDEKEQEILNMICKCAYTTPEELQREYKTRKGEFVKARQVHMVIRNLVIRHNESTATTGAIYNKDHATFLHAKKRVINALEGFDKEFREQFRGAFEMTRMLYPEKAEEKFNLKWL